MKRLLIIFLASLVWAAFSKIHGDGFKEYALFPFSDIKMIWPIYLWNICIQIVPIAFIWTLVSQETERPKEMKIVAWIISFKMVDFVLRCNTSYFHIGDYPISYDTVVFVLLGLVLLKATLYD